MSKTFARLLATIPATSLLYLLSFVGTAQAAPTVKNCSVQSIQYDEGPRLFIICTDGTQFYSFLNGSAGSCQSRSLDTIKIWESMLMSIFLSGKHASLTYEPAGAACGVNALYAVTAAQ